MNNPSMWNRSEQLGALIKIKANLLECRIDKLIELIDEGRDDADLQAKLSDALKAINTCIEISTVNR